MCEFPVLDYAAVWFGFYTKPRLKDLILFVFRRKERKGVIFEAWLRLEGWEKTKAKGGLHHNVLWYGEGGRRGPVVSRPKSSSP